MRPVALGRKNWIHIGSTFLFADTSDVDFPCTGCDCKRHAATCNEPSLEVRVHFGGGDCHENRRLRLRLAADTLIPHREPGAYPRNRKFSWRNLAIATIKALSSTAPSRRKFNFFFVLALG